MIERRPWWHISNRLPRNPFNEAPADPHLQWCHKCEMDVDVQIEAANADGIDVYRKRCLRCGTVLSWGIGRRHIVSAKPLPEKALRFVQETGKDRR